MLCGMAAFNAGAQVNFKAVLLNAYDSTAMPFAGVKLVENGVYGQYTATSEKGEFSFTLSQKTETLKLEISSVECRATVVIKPTYARTEKIYVTQSAIGIGEVVIEGWTPRRVVEKAVADIPRNYADSSYGAYSFYRQYQKVNGVYRNLAEANMMVLFKLSTQKNTTACEEAFAVEQVRRSHFTYPVKGFYGDECSGLFKENPVYHLQESSLHPGAFKDYRFAFDTLQSDTFYIVTYTSPASNEPHGVGNFAESGVKGEAREYGRLYIHKKSFAIARYERNAVRNQKYSYAWARNFLIPDRRYTVEFLDASLVVEYREIKGKWYLQKMLYNYANAFYKTQVYTKDFVVTDAFEWYAGEMTRQVPAALAEQFFVSPNVSGFAYDYAPAQWNSLPPFYFDTRENIYRDLETKTPLETQFQEGRTRR